MEGRSILVGIHLGEDWLCLQFPRDRRLRFRGLWRKAAMQRREFELLGGIAKPDTYSVTLENGYNLPMSVVASYAANNISITRPCESMDCRANADVVCPKDLQIKKKGSAVTACNGHFNGYLPSSPAFNEAFKKACPRAFPFHRCTICPPSTTSYTLIFCPRHPSHLFSRFASFHNT